MEIKIFMADSNWFDGIEPTLHVINPIYLRIVF